MYRFDKKHLYVMLAIFAIYFLTAQGQSIIISTLLTLPGVLLAMTVHEFAHAKMADHFGDTTARRQGRLTLNPLAHIEPVGLFLLIFANIGWGRPVEVNYSNLTSNKSRGYCEAMISLAGPLANFILAFILTVIYFAIGTFARAFTATLIGEIIGMIVFYAISVNIGLGVFNLIPLPPLDGEKIFRNIMPDSIERWLNRNTEMLQFAFLILWITGLLGYVVSPVINIVYKGLFGIVSVIFGIF